MTQQRQQVFRVVNQSLGQQPSLGPIPANLLAPSGLILVLAYFLTQVLLRLGFTAFMVVSAWGISSWWIVVGEKTWKFTNKFVAVPDWKRSHIPYIRYLNRYDD
ncbi:MAG: hypothetical protein KME07_12985 [Pegethrix bostrychoides GSE-TBD4-15B]|jgi:hypothetical protein|uniref:Uncharacterized protein n=1 Tax=Pegethrix bostrychoides GSE-TBD4-15B TaxID=2839662 RepID=A0A951U528_9CYAN|nr:hypothetical protein [Pegethrix bostrychoides GSE-TBD4-15B]